VRLPGTAASRRRLTLESGVSTVEYSIAFTGWLVAVLVVFHFWMHFTAAEAAADAAAEVLEAMSVADADTSQAKANRIAGEILNGEPGVRPGWTVVVTSGLTETTVTVNVVSHQFLPGLPDSIQQSATGFTDRFIGQDDR